MAKSTIKYIHKKKEHTGKIRNAKRPGKAWMTNIFFFHKKKQKQKNSWPDQEPQSGRILNQQSSNVLTKINTKGLVQGGKQEDLIRFWPKHLLIY